MNENRRSRLARLLGRVASVAVAVCMAVSLAACATGAGASAGTGAATTGSTGHNVAMIINGPMNDGGWFSACYEAMQEAASDLGWGTTYSENISQADYVSTMQNYIDQGFDLILLPGEEYADAAKQVAKDNPDAKFAILMGTEDDVEGIEGMYYDDAQVGKLAGSLAALLSKTNSIGFIGGQELDNTQAKMQNYEAMAKQVNPAIQVTSVFVGSFSDVAKGKEAGSVMFGQDGADVLFGDSNAEENGAIEAMKEANADGTPRYVIGLSSDLGGKDDEVYANSVVLDHKVLFEQAMKDAESGSFGKKAIKGDLSNGGIKMGTFSDKLVSADVQAKFEEYVEKIKGGEL